MADTKSEPAGFSPGKTITTTYGKLVGIAPDSQTFAWYGIPYASPPVGNLRWKPPVPPAPWTGVREAFAYGDQAAQNPTYKSYGEGGMSEDCLYLNVIAPNDAKNVAVMVWLHGGAFEMLTANMKSYNNHRALPANGVVLVTVNHRLGPFGYMAHPLLTKASGYGGSGNYGQLDLIAALEWVRDNIAAFGGDPNNVTLFGQSGGGAKAISLMASPLAVGLFHKVICQSGMVQSDNAFMNPVDLATAEARGTNLSKRLGTKNLAQLRALDWEEIVNSDLQTYGDKIGLYGPNLDGHYLERTQLEAIQKGLASDVPFMAGANTTDLVSEGDLTLGLIEQMPIRAKYCKAPLFAYKFSHIPSGWRKLGAKAYHGAELIYLFKYPVSFVTHFLLGLTALSREDIGDLTGDGIVASVNDIFMSLKYGAEDAALEDKVVSMWTNFAKTGNPSIPGEIEWKPYTIEADQFLDISASPAMRTGLGQAFA